MDYLDDDMDIDGLSDTSDTRDILHAELAKNNVRNNIYYFLIPVLRKETYILTVFYNFISATSIYIGLMSGFTDWWVVLCLPLPFSPRFREQTT